MQRKTYTARCQRSGDWWAISVPELSGVHTQARRLEKAGAMAGDAVALLLDVPPDSFDVKIEPVLPRDHQTNVGRARKARDEAEILQHEAAIASSEAAADLVGNAHLTIRDAGRVLGLPINRSRSSSSQLQAKPGACISVELVSGTTELMAVDARESRVAGGGVGVVIHVVNQGEDSCKSGRKGHFERKDRTETARIAMARTH